MSKEPFKIFSGRYSRYLADEIAKKLGIEVGEMQVNEFADGEFQVSYEESVRGDEIYLVQSMFPPTDNLMELLLMIDAAKRASAKSVTAVIPYFGWARQDRKDRPRVSIAAKLVAGMLTSAGVSAIDGNYRLRGGLFGEFTDSLAAFGSYDCAGWQIHICRVGW